MKTPKTLGRYRILGEISRGAMGRVYLAHDPHIDRRVAIKTIHPVDGLSEADAQENRLRFIREAQAAGRLQNPGIVTIYDVGVHEGTSFIAMEYIEGETLEAFTRPGSLLPVTHVADLMAQACDALDYAHQEKVVHRDIKPANLMILKNGQLKITDFGLAKNPSTSLTQDGTLMGTPNYMSPEQIMGRPLDGRSDLFSLGAVLYEMLTGNKPFTGESVTTIIYRIIHEEPQLPSLAMPSVPESLSRVVAKALDKQPGNRFQTGREFADALRGRKAATMMVGAVTPVSGLPDSDEMADGEERWSAHDDHGQAAGMGSGQRVQQSGATRGSGGARPTTIPVARGARPARASVAVAQEREGWLRRPWVQFGFIGMVTAAVIVLLPARTTDQDRWGRGGDDGTPPFYTTAAILAGGAAPAGPAKQVPPPLPTAAVPGALPTVSVALASDPPGAKFYVDDRELAGADLVLPEDDKVKHTIVAENDCFIETIDFNLGKNRNVTIPLKTPKVAPLSVTSSPPGAQILLDGKTTRSVTPSEIPVSLCGTHAIGLRLAGYLDVTRSVEDPRSALSVKLEPIPKGHLEVASPYPVTLYEGSAKIGESGQRIQLTAGEHTIRMVNEALFVDRPVKVTVKANAVARPDASLPGTGTLTVLASPGNCTIFVQDREVGAPPINDLPLAEGSYKVKAVYVPTGESKEMTVTITAGGSKRVPFRFNP